ncbi:type II toxin-antitoxin system RelE/ParE family toxin [uncultured Paracoccus sp.]|uniref:type II toxin-antitoxin system RelE/ParE family toxin n=1 Tax=uncultured Paracoccus sp. TaxID=189685 RepID=UPI0025F37099|nr:type II toxin-antitoxin system RelE/ParE family toxin [uncultured Paracoccus sp.]
MPELLISSLAREDLKEIGRYTQQNWGIRQRNSYLRAFSAKFDDIRNGVAAGQQRPDIRPGLLSIPCNRHVIFFRRNPARSVEILRILHQRMDFHRHL